MHRDNITDYEILPTTSLSKTHRVKPSAPTSLDTRSNARPTKSARVMSMCRIDALVNAGESAKLRLSVSFAKPESILDRA